MTQEALVQIGTNSSTNPLARIVEASIPFYGKTGLVEKFATKVRDLALRATTAASADGVSDALTDHILANVNATSESEEGSFLSEVETRNARAQLIIRQGTTNLATMPTDTPLGKLFSTAGEIVGTPLRVHLLYAYQMNLRYPPMGEGNRAPVCKSPDGKLGSPGGWCLNCTELPFGLQNGGAGEQKKTECAQWIVFIVITEDMKHIYEIGMSRTSLKTAKTMATLAKAAGTADKLVRRVFILETESKMNAAQQRYFQFKVAVDTKDKELSAADHAALVGLSDLLQAQNHLVLARYYATVREGKTVAAANEAAFDPQAAMGTLDAGGAEPNFDATGTPPAARNSNTPM